MGNRIKAVVAEFKIDGSFLRARPCGSGHINDTYLVGFSLNNKENHYIIQRINHQVFKHPPLLMENILRVTDHIHDKLKSTARPDGVQSIRRRVLSVIPTYGGQSLYRDPQGNYWRAYPFVENTKSFDVLSTESQGFQVAYAFGDFLCKLADFPVSTLHHTIPGFHDGPARLATFEEVLKNDPANRAHTAKEEIRWVLRHREFFFRLPRLVKEGLIPLRVTHNDTKVNNVMLDKETGEGVCVIDLDTVMPGYSLYDFGDLGRSALSRTAEDTMDLQAIDADVEMFKAIARGYLDGAGSILTAAEIDNLVFAAQLMTQLVGLRFLTDYLEGDIYFKTQRPGQNLQRSRTHFQLVRSIMEKEDTLLTFLQEQAEKRITTYS
ncbi:MAG: aminoglycoside phosphotransferase family protein [bacterium]|nr:aminoglycoside phosphotransferase family protein [bacterium]